MVLNPLRFYNILNATPLPHLVTSRPPRHGEVNNRDYQFVSRDELEDEAASGTLVEHGEFKGHLYGTSSVSLKSMINAGYVVLITPHYQVRITKSIILSQCL